MANPIIVIDGLAYRVPAQEGAGLEVTRAAPDEGVIDCDAWAEVEYFDADPDDQKVIDKALEHLRGPDLADVLRRIAAARDYFAEHGEYLPNEGPSVDQGFDDWAADLAQAALA